VRRSRRPAAGFQAFCAARHYLPELVSLAETVDVWWDEIEAYVLTGITNAGSEGVNRLIKSPAIIGYATSHPPRIDRKTAR
jgi:transposase